MLEKVYGITNIHWLHQGRFWLWVCVLSGWPSGLLGYYYSLGEISFTMWLVTSVLVSEWNLWFSNPTTLTNRIFFLNKLSHCFYFNRFSRLPMMLSCWLTRQFFQSCFGIFSYVRSYGLLCLKTTHKQAKTNEQRKRSFVCLHDGRLV